MGASKSKQDVNVLNSSEAFDVCIIGSGPAGTTLGTSLVQQGIRTVIIESGDNMLRWIFDSRLKGLAAYDYTGDTEYPLTKTKSRLIGGNSNFWTGRCERLHPSDFADHPYVPSGNPWPVTYEGMDPYYEKAETLMRVRSGVRSEYCPPRKNPYTLPPKPDLWYLKSLFSKIGVEVDDSPTATPTKTFRFFKVQKEILPTFLQLPYATLIRNMTATKVITDENRNIVGAEVTSIDGNVKTVRAKKYVVACGGIESPRLLLLSKSEQFPEGIGNSYDMVGRGFNEHPAVNYYAKINHELGTIQPTNKIGRSHQFYSKYRAEGLGSILPVFRQSWVLPHHMMEFKLANIPRNTLSILKRFIKPTLYIGVTIEQKVSDSNRVTLSEGRKDIFGNPLSHLIFNYCEEDLRLLDRCRELTLDMYNKLGATEIQEAQVTWSRHHQGTCRMGANPKTSVVDRDLKVHETQNLYVCGSEIFVTGGAMQPCLSIVAFSLRLADHIAAKIKKEQA